MREKAAGILKHLGKMILAIGAAVAAAGILMILVYLIPTERMFANAKKSVGIFEAEGASSQMIHGYISTTLDNYTDAWMLRIAYYEGREEVTDRAFHNYYNYITGGVDDDLNEYQRIIAHLRDEEGNLEKGREDYSRYWHGYLVVLKPLLAVFDYGDIRQILKISSLFLILYIGVLLERKGLRGYIFPFGGALACLEFSTIGMSMQYTWVFLIAAVSSLFILKKYNVCGGQTHNWMFLIIGCLTSFFDFLTYPLFTLAFPIIMLCMCYTLQERKSTKQFILYLVETAVHWVIGYVGMWGGKWVCMDIFWREGRIKDGIHSIVERSGRGGETYLFGETVMRNVSILLKWPYFLCSVFVLGIILFGMKQEQQLRAELVIAYAGIAALPFIWYFISLNHSFIHAHMTYKELSITVFAGSLAVLELKKGWNWQRHQK